MTIVRSDGKKNIRREKKVQISNGQCIRRGQVHLLTMNVPLEFQWILDCRYCLMPYPVKNARKKTGRLSLSMKKMFYNWTIAFVSNKKKFYIWIETFLNRYVLECLGKKLWKVDRFLYHAQWRNQDFQTNAL
jgi:hypothetical protein